MALLGIDVQDPNLATKTYVDEAIAAIGGGGGEAVQNSFLNSGGQVTWQSAYEFLVSAASYYIGGVLYSSPQTTITLDAADPTDDRIDTIAVDDNGAVIKVTGTAASTPSEPDIDPGTQLKLALVFVGASTTEPVAVQSAEVYHDNAGSPTEWNATASGASINVNSSNNPRTGTKSIEGTTVVAGVYAQLQIGAGTIVASDYDSLIFYIRSKAQWNNNRGLQISLRISGAIVGVVVTLNRSGTFGFVSSNTSDYQQVAIPISQFAVPAGVTINQVRIADFGGSIGFYLDDITFQGGAVQQTPVGITQAQADARYAQLAVAYPAASVDSEVALYSGSTGKILKRASATGFATVAAGVLSAVTLKGSAGISIDGGGSAIEASGSRMVQVPYGGTIVAARIIADQAGDISFDIQKSTWAGFPPTSSIVAGAPPNLTNDQTYEDTGLSGWTLGITAGDVLEFIWSGAADCEWVILQLEINRSN